MFGKIHGKKYNHSIFREKKLPVELFSSSNLIEKDKKKPFSPAKMNEFWTNEKVFDGQIYPLVNQKFKVSKIIYYLYQNELIYCLL